MVRPSGTEAPGARRCGQADLFDELRARVSSWPPLRLARLRRERGSVGVVLPAAPATQTTGGANDACHRHRPPPDLRGGGDPGERGLTARGPDRHDPDGVGGLRISKIGRSHARAILVEAAWAAAKTPGPLHAFFVRIRARRGHPVAAVAVARKRAVLCWHMLSKEEDYLWARPALVANQLRAMELQAGRPQQKGKRRGPAYACNVKALREQEIQLARQAELSYERFVAAWRPRPPRQRVRGRLKPARPE